jgi:4'-phosphopantetheinyl transferase
MVRLEIGRDTIKVFMAAVSSLTVEHYDLLSGDERERAARFVFEKDRRLFVLGRAMLRTVLGSVLEIPGADVPLVVSASGKPKLPGGNGPAFNLSHSGIYAVMAVSRGRQVGIDIEMRRSDSDFLAVAREYFSAAELARLDACPAQAEAFFFRYWTLKEAYLKATGAGLAGLLRHLDVSWVPDASAASNPWLPGGIGLQVVNAPPGYAAAVAADGCPWRISVEPWLSNVSVFSAMPARMDSGDTLDSVAVHVPTQVVLHRRAEDSSTT